MIFNELRKSLKQYQNEVSKQKKKLTPEFNLVSLISPKELQLSKIIAEFLNPNGRHEQKELFLKKFVQKFIPNKRNVKYHNINVILEFGKNVNGRIDILIDFDGEYAIAIENKPFANDQNEQIIHYVNYLKDNYRENFTMMYLSTFGQPPTEKSLPKDERKKLGNEFAVISYRDIRDWLIETSILINPNSTRLKLLIDEFIEYVNINFLKTNKLKHNMLNQTIERNILDAFEIHKTWTENKDDFERIWIEKVNNLFNFELPKLVCNELIKRNVITENWLCNQGYFSIEKRAVSGFEIKHKNWNEFSYALLKSRSKSIKGSANIFPAIKCKKNPKEIKFSNKNYLIDYSKATNNSKIENEFWSIPPIIWWTDFPDDNYNVWSYEQWIEIKPNGKTVKYVVDFFEKLILASKSDIEKTENAIK